MISDAHDGVGLLEDRNGFGCHLADDSNTETRTRERLPPHDVIRQSEFGCRPTGPRP